MKISIVTTAYNAEAYIEETLESVLLQRGDFYLEYIVIDAMSSDSTLEKIHLYKKRLDDGYFDGRNNGIDMIVLSEKDNGMYEGIAKGLKLATGEIVAYINADDFYQQNAFSLVCHFFKNNKEVKWLTGLAAIYNEGGNIIEVGNCNIFDSSMIQKGLYGLHGTPYIQQESTFWKHDLLDLIDYAEFSQYKLAGDFYLWHNFAKHYQLYSIKTILSGFRVRKGQLSESLSKYTKEVKEITHYYVPTEMEKEALLKVRDTSVYLMLEKGFLNNIDYNIADGRWNVGSTDIFLGTECYKMKLLGLPLLKSYKTGNVTSVHFLSIPILKIKKFKTVTRCYLFSFIKFLTIRRTQSIVGKNT